VCEVHEDHCEDVVRLEEGEECGGDAIQRVRMRR
jgi:hypothetical protein